MRGFSLSGSACAILVVLALSGPSLSPAEELTFFPSIVQTEGTLGINANLQSSEYRQGAKRTSSTGTFLSERLNLGAGGYVYHPRFEVFTIRLSEALNQANVHGTDPDRSVNSAMDYELRTTFLPSHPYNLELFALHREASSLINFGSGQRGEMNERGAIFNYKNNPYFLNLGYTRTSVDSSANRSDSTVYRASGSYNGRIMSQNAAYSQTDSRSAAGDHTERDDLSYSNSIRYTDVVLNSRVGSRTTDQRDRTDNGLHAEGFSWSEMLSAPLPGDFKADLSFSYQDEKDRREGGAAGPAGNEEFNRSTGASFHLSHHLYQSLVTNFTENRTSTTSTAGEITGRSDMLSLNYTKKIPTGLLAIGTLYGTSTSERSGTTTIINEMHNAVLGGNFTLSQQNIRSGSLVIEVRDPATGTLMSLPSDNTIVVYLGGVVQITITGVSPAAQQPDPAYLYEFRVSYALSDQSTIDTTFMGYSLRADIIENRLNAYFRYDRSQQELTSGSIPGGPDVNVSEIIGLNAQKGPYSGNIEHQTYRSRVTPLEAWNMAAQYRDTVAEDVHVSARLTSTWTEHVPSPGSFGYHDRTYGADAGMDRRLPGKNVTVFMSFSYYMFRSIIDSDRMSFNTYATWQMGLLSVNGGAQLSRSETLYATGSTSLTSQNYYVMLSRKLF